MVREWILSLRTMSPLLDFRQYVLAKPALTVAAIVFHREYAFGQNKVIAFQSLLPFLRSHPISSEQTRWSPSGCTCAQLISSEPIADPSSLMLFLSKYVIVPLLVEYYVLTLHSIQSIQSIQSILLHSLLDLLHSLLDLLHSLLDLPHSWYMTASRFYWILTSPILIHRSIVIASQFKFCRIKHQQSNLNRYVIASQFCKLCWPSCCHQFRRCSPLGCTW